MQLDPAHFQQMLQQMDSNFDGVMTEEELNKHLTLHHSEAYEKKAEDHEGYMDQ